MQVLSFARVNVNAFHPLNEEKRKKGQNNYPMSYQKQAESYLGF
jgi:hypothetical protein